MAESDNILGFISVEHNNELVSVANLKAELGFAQELDEIYQEIRQAFRIDANNDVQCIVATLYLQAHNEFYIGLSQLLKSHLGKALISLRIAIEDAFLAYYFTKNPKNIREYMEESSKLHKQVFWRIKDFVAKKPKEYPLAAKLIKMHETASNFSAHASFNSIAFKFQHVKDVENKKEEMLLGYFDSLKLDTYLFYYFSFLKSFFEVFRLFYECYFKSEFKIILPDRDKRIAEYEKKVDAKGKYYNQKRKQS
jgi:hypothetical protein